MSLDSCTCRYAAYGAAFGALFPVLATLFDAGIRLNSLSLGSLISVQSSQPLHWMIDSAPFFLGLFASFAGRRQDRVLAVNAELRRAEAELRRTNESLMAAAQAKSQFLAKMSHELRTPLNAIIGFSRILTRKLADRIDSQQQENLRLVLQSGLQMLALVNDLLDLEKISAGTLHMQTSVVDCGALIGDVLRAARPAADAKGIGLQHVAVDPALKLRTDGNRLRQVVANLVNNAITYSDGGVVTASCVRDAEKKTVAISVSDEGIGIAPDAVEHIFEAFAQVDAGSERSRGGAGLGLAIVKQLTQLLEGSVEVVSRVGCGSTFTVSFPESIVVNAAAASERRGPEPRGSGPIVLVIDDQMTNLEVIAADLSEAGYRVHTATNGQEGLEKARALKPDAIVLDIIMPEMDGWQVLVKLRQDPGTSSIPVVVSSVLDRSPSGCELGVAGWLPKPVDADELHRMLRPVLKTQTMDVLAVDDDAATRSLIEQELRGTSCRVRTVESGRAALAALQDRIPDVLVLDLGLPDMEGLEVYRRLRSLSHGHHVSVVFFTGRDLSASDRARLNDGLAEIVDKGQGSLACLVGAVRRALTARSLPPPSIGQEAS